MKGNQQKTVLRVLDVTIVLLCIAIACVVVGIVKEYIYDNTYKVAGENYLFQMRDNDYHALVGYAYTDSDITGDKVEYVAVAKYFEAASLYKVYETSGDTQRQERMLVRMNEEAGKISKLTSEKDKIDELLEIVP